MTPFGATAGDGGVAFGEGATIHGNVAISLGVLEAVDPKHKQELRLRFEKQVRDYPEQTAFHFALGLSYLDLRLYRPAFEALEKAMGSVANEADLLYYLTLAQIGGRPLRLLRSAEVREMEARLEAATKLQPDRAHFPLLWAFLKSDYYLRNGLRLRAPSIDQLMGDAAQARGNPAEVRQLLRHIDSPSVHLLQPLNWFHP